MRKTNRPIVLLAAALLLAPAIAGAAPGKAYQPDKNTVLLLHCDAAEGGVVKDSSEFENDGKIKGGVEIVKDGPFGSSARFDGTSGSIDCGSDRSFGITGAVTLECWLKPVKTPGEDKQIIGAKGGVAGGYALFYGSRNNVYAYMVTAEQKHKYIPSEIALKDDVWQHIAFTYDGKNTVKWYLDGRLVGTDTQSISGPMVYYAGTRFIAGLYGLDRFFKGSLAEIRVSNVARESFSSVAPRKD